MTDLTKFANLEYIQEREVFTALFFLNESDVLEVLKYKEVFVLGKIYKTPRKQLLELLIDNMLPCNVELELELLL